MGRGQGCNDYDKVERLRVCEEQIRAGPGRNTAVCVPPRSDLDGVKDQWDGTRCRNRVFDRDFWLGCRPEGRSLVALKVVRDYDCRHLGPPVGGVTYRVFDPFDKPVSAIQPWASEYGGEVGPAS